MIAAERVAVVLLAAGASIRFGPRNKLAESLDGLPLGLHVAKMLSELPFLARIVVSCDDELDFNAYGFISVRNDDASAGQAGSIRLGLRQARRVDAEAILIMLADMPFVTRSHVLALLGLSREQDPVVGSTDGSRRSPPALFRASLYPALDALSGDAGARALLREAIMVKAASSELADFDTPADFAAVTPGRPSIRFPRPRC